MSDFMRRFQALLRKEVRQMLRDKSNLAVAFLLPISMILLFGYGLSFDVKQAPIALVLEEHSTTAQDMVAGLKGSSYFIVVPARTMPEAEQLLRARTVTGIVRVPQDFSRRLAASDGRIQLLLNGVDSTTAQAIEAYVNGAIGLWAEKQAERAGNKAEAVGQAVIIQRTWFNATQNSAWYLVPGLLVLVLTLIGALLTSLLIAREWERGTLESLFATPVRPLEIVLSKLAPYILVGAVDLILCLLAAHFIFEVPIRGSLSIIFAASLVYLIISLLLGLFISAATRSQFQASQLALLLSFMPALMLSGFVFDLRNVPIVIQGIAYLLPSTYFMSLVKTLLLVGDYWPVILQSLAILCFYTALLIFFTYRKLRKTLD